MHKWKTMLTGLTAAAVLSGTASVAGAAVCGDLNNSGGATPRAINDVVILLRSVSNLETDSALCGGLGVLQCGDINANGAKDIGDVVTLLRNVSNIETVFPICVGEGPQLAGCPGPVNLPNQINSNVVIPAGCAVFVNGTTFVEPGVVLTVKAGAVVKGVKGSATPSALIVKPDAKINAVGTSVNPILFTSDQTPGTRNKGDWGGVALLGRAPVNTDDGTSTLEGLPATADLVFGGTESNDSSGVMRFVRVEFSGRELSPNNELNLFVMAGVGRGTTVDHIQGHNGLDDCIEWFGGTVNTKFMVGSACGDDGFDTQLGTRGALQFGLIAQERTTVESGGSNGWESDNNEGGFDNTPVTDAKYCNVTALGILGQGAPSITNQVGALFRRGTAIRIANSIIKDFASSGTELRDVATALRACDNGTTLHSVAPFGSIENTIFFNNAVNFRDNATAPANGPCSTSQWATQLQASRGVVVGDPGFGAGNTFPPTPAQYIPAIGSLADTATAANCTGIDGSFVNTGYIGGFEPGGADWTSGWTAYPLN